MTRTIAIIAAAALTLAAPVSSAGAQDMTQATHVLREGHAVETKLGENALAVTYWVSRTDGWHVVTTVDLLANKTGEAQPAIIRFSSLLGAGQSQFISVPLTLGERQQIVRIRRLDDKIDVTLVSDPAS